jgi:hypothetical protein
MNTTCPITNQRKARCRHCHLQLLPGEGIRYPSQFAYGGSHLYYCPTCATARQKREADQETIDANLQTIATSLERRFGGPVDTSSCFGAILLTNTATALYGRLRNLINASGMYALEVSEAIAPVIASAPDQGAQNLFQLAEAVTLHTLSDFYHQKGSLPWAAYPLVQAVQLAQITQPAVLFP